MNTIKAVLGMLLVCSFATASELVAVQNIESNKAVYVKVQEATGLDWRLVGAIHYREASNRFDRSIQDGRRITGDWATHAAQFINKWRAGARLKVPQTRAEMLEFAERWNGLGYRRMGAPSPYVWSGTDQYVKGKFTADGKYDPDVVDKQLGVAVILGALGV